ncbi:MAG: C-type lectin domain-containing protein [Rhodospirillales bacterium]
MKFAALILTLAATAAISTPAGAKALYNTPVYHAETKSYFELVPVPHGHSMRDKSSPETDWTHAMRFAAGRMFKETRGRLAVIKSQDTNDFLVRTFDPPQSAWFGLRFFCGVRKLIWVTGDVHPPNGFKNWGPTWQAPGDAPCAGGQQWAPIALARTDAGFRWEARGQAKEFFYYLVEYPTGKP